MKEQIIHYGFLASDGRKKRSTVIYEPYPSKEYQLECERLWKQLCDSSQSRRPKRDKH